MTTTTPVVDRGGGDGGDHGRGIGRDRCRRNDRRRPPPKARRAATTPRRRAEGSTAGTDGDTPAAGEPEKCAEAARGRRHQGRHPALAERHDVDQRGRGARRRAARDQGDQRRRRRARQADRAGRRGRRVRLADLRREGGEAAHRRQGGRRVRWLDVGQPQGDAAGVRGPQRAAVLPGAVRGPGGVAEHLLHRRHHQPADHPGARLPQGAGDDQGLPRRLRLRLPPHGQQDHQGLRRGERVWRSSARTTCRSATPTSRPSCRRSSTPSPTSCSTR